METTIVTFRAPVTMKRHLEDVAHSLGVSQTDLLVAGLELILEKEGEVYQTYLARKKQQDEVIKAIFEGYLDNIGKTAADFGIDLDQIMGVKNEKQFVINEGRH